MSCIHMIVCDIHYRLCRKDGELKVTWAINEVENFNYIALRNRTQKTIKRTITKFENIYYI